jgi:hypothetical protein
MLSCSRFSINISLVSLSLLYFSLSSFFTFLFRRSLFLQIEIEIGNKIDEDSRPRSSIGIEIERKRSISRLRSRLRLGSRVRARLRSRKHLRSRMGNETQIAKRDQDYEGIWMSWKRAEIKDRDSDRNQDS